MEITAEQAKKNADEINNIRHKSELNKILSRIEEISKDGEYSINIDYQLMDETIVKLRTLGFKIETGGRMGEIEFYIYW